jgi:membrane protein
MRKQKFAELVSELIGRFRDDEVPALAAQMTFYVILSFFPFMMFLIALTTYTPLSREYVLDDLLALMPDVSAALIRGVFNDILSATTPTLLSLSAVAALWSASNGMMAIIRTLNKAYDVEERRPFWKVRGIAVLYTAGFSAVVVVALTLLVFGEMIGRFTTERGILPAFLDPVWSGLDVVLSLGVMCGVFVLLYRSAPSRRVRFAEAVPGAVLTTAGWVAISWLFSEYVRLFGDFSKTYGSLGGVIVLLLWLYLGSMVVLAGGELNAALAFLKDGRRREERKPFGIRLPFFKKR